MGGDIKINFDEDDQYFLADQVIKNMNIKNVWNWLSGKKTYIAMGLLFVYGGLSYLGVEVPYLKEVALWLGGLGLAHKGFKVVLKEMKSNFG